MSKKVRVELGERGYDINIGNDFKSLITINGASASALLVSDSHVDPLYGDLCQTVLTDAGFKVKRAEVPAGESTKSLDFAKNLYDAALSAALDRKSYIFALGGGVVGDLAGFVAGTYLRGIRFIQLPTSLLAMVDSSVGGKTAVNLPQGKNLVGVFYQPRQVAINLTTLQTLPDREYFSGMAEIIKYGIIMDAGFFALLEEKVEQLLARDIETLRQVIARCCEIKAQVVGLDERESGLRAILNYGHTLGHAIENSCGYGELLHGEAIAIGMVYAGELSVQHMGLAPESASRVKDLLKKFNLPVDKTALPRRLAWTELRDIMSTDKKAKCAIPSFVLAKELGQVSFGCEISEALLEKCWQTL